MDGLLQHRHVLQAGRILKKAFGDTTASAVRTETTFPLLPDPKSDKHPGGKENILSACKSASFPRTHFYSCGGTVLKVYIICLIGVKQAIARTERWHQKIILTLTFVCRCWAQIPSVLMHCQLHSLVLNRLGILWAFRRTNDRDLKTNCVVMVRSFHFAWTSINERGFTGGDSTWIYNSRGEDESNNHVANLPPV